MMRQGRAVGNDCSAFGSTPGDSRHGCGRRARGGRCHRPDGMIAANAGPPRVDPDPTTDSDPGGGSTGQRLNVVSGRICRTAAGRAGRGALSNSLKPDGSQSSPPVATATPGERSSGAQNRGLSLGLGLGGQRAPVISELPANIISNFNANFCNRVRWSEEVPNGKGRLPVDGRCLICQCGCLGER